VYSTWTLKISNAELKLASCTVTEIRKYGYYSPALTLLFEVKQIPRLRF